MSHLTKQDELVEFMESQLSESSREALKAELQKQPHLKTDLQKLKATKSVVKKEQDSDVPTSSDFYLNLENRIMSQISASKNTISILDRINRKLNRRFVKSFAAAAVVLASYITFFKFHEKSSTSPRTIYSDSATEMEDENLPTEKMLLLASRTNPQVFQEVLGSDVSQPDLVFQIAAEKIQGLSRKEALKLWDQMTE
jgi:hypothetical protein